MTTISRFTQKFADAILSTLNCHDRVIFKGYLPYYRDDDLHRLSDWELCMRRKDFVPFLEDRSEELVAHAKQMAGEHYQYFESKPDKEALIRKKIQRRGVIEGLVAVLCCKETCRGFKLRHEEGRIDWSRAAVDSTHARALGRGEKTGKNPSDRRKLGSKHHIVTDAQGIPLAVTITGSNVHDVKELLHVVDAIPNGRGKVGYPRKRPDVLYGDRAYDSEPHRRALKRRGICPQLAHRCTEHGSGLGIYRWVVERTGSWLHSFRKLRLQTDRAAGIHEAFVTLASSLICMWFL